MINARSMQNYWFPGHVNHRSIFDFTNNVLNIESPGFPLVPEDSNNFGNIITLENDIGYYLIGKYLMDANFSVVTGSNGIFDNVPAHIACCAFSPDKKDTNAVHLYFIDSDGLHYGHISSNIIKESTINSLTIIPLTHTPVKNSPLCILGDSTGEGNWLFYLTLENNHHSVAAVYCEADTECNCTTLILPIEGNATSIDISKNRIAMVFENSCVVYGTLLATSNTMGITIDGTISDISADFVQSAFSISATSLFWMTKEGNQCSINYMDLLSGKITTSPTSGIYKALKRGPDNIIYGLSHQTLGTSTLLTIAPKAPYGGFSITEIYESANGGYFPATGWDVYSL